MPWFGLIVAGLFEVGWAVSMKLSQGFSRLWPTVAALVSMIISVGLLSFALRALPLGTAYAVWTGIGAIGTTVMGIALFGESTNWIRLACIAMIAAGIAGLRLNAP